MKPKSTKNRRKIDFGRFGRPRPFRGRVRTRSGRFLDIHMPPQSRSWGAPGAPRAARSHPKASPGQPRDAPRARGAIPETPVSAARIGQRSWKRLRIDFSTFSVNARRVRSAFCIAPASVLSMSDVLRLKRLPRAKTSKKTVVSGSKIEARGVLGTLGRASSSAKTAKSSEKARLKSPWGLRKLFTGCERGNFERDGAPSAPEERAGPRTLRGVISESSNG